MSGSGMYGHEAPEPVRLWDLDRMELCPASLGPGSQLAKPQLERWKSVHEAIVAWHAEGEPESEAAVADICDRLFSFWDPVQRHMLEDLFTAYRRLHPSDSTVEFDAQSGVFIDTDRNLSLSVGVQLEVQTEIGREAVRIKTGRSGTSRVEAAAYYMHDEKSTLVDVMLAHDDRVNVPRPTSEDGQQILSEIFDRHALAIVGQRGVRHPGLHCYSCPRPARCGQYPTIGGDVSYRTRTVRVSKTHLAKLAHCHRSAGWPALYGIPKDESRGDDEDDSHGLRVGSRFHTTIAAALLADDPEPLFEAACAEVPPSEATDLRYLFDQHLDLWTRDPDPVTPIRTEYQMGLTLVVPGQTLNQRDKVEEGPVAVVMMCATDVNGWENDTTAAVVEHRTGASGPLPNEADLYAVSAWTALQQMNRNVDGVAVHFHHLRRNPSQCQRIHYTQHDIQKAIDRLTDVAGVIAGWHPASALSPQYATGPQCDWCDRRSRCEQFR